MAISSFGVRRAIRRELTKRPWTEEERDARAQMLVEAVTLSSQTDNREAMRRSEELRRQLVNDDVGREIQMSSDDDGSPRPGRGQSSESCGAVFREEPA